IRWVRARPLHVSSLRKIAASYRALTFMGIGSAEAPALAAFVGVFVMGAYWIYLVGLPISLTSLLLAGPKSREIARRQEQIDAQGSSLSLVQGLMETRLPG